MIPYLQQTIPGTNYYVGDEFNLYYALIDQL